MSFYFVSGVLGFVATAFLVKDPLGIVAKIKNKVLPNIGMYREVATLQNIYDLGLFKLRIFLSEHLETGFLSRRPGPGPIVYDLTYFDGPTKYTVRFSKTRGPSPFSHVTFLDKNAEIQDVTDTIRRFAGPSHNFYGIPTTPDLLGFSNLTFYYRDGTNATFEQHDVISTVPKMKIANKILIV